MNPAWINRFLDAQVRAGDVDLDQRGMRAVINFLTTVQATEEVLERMAADPDVRTFQASRLVRNNLDRLARLLDEVPSLERVYGDKFTPIQKIVGKALVTSPFELSGIQTLAQDFRELRRLVETPG